MAILANPRGECAAVKEAVVAKRLSDLGNTIDYLDSRISSLGERLQPVSSNYPNAKTCENAPEPEPVQCAVASNISNLAARVSAAAERVQSLISSLEI